MTSTRVERVFPCILSLLLLMRCMLVPALGRYGLDGAAVGNCSMSEECVIDS